MNVQEQISQSKQVQKDKRQDRHRLLNSLLLVAIFIASCFVAVNLSDDIEVVEKKSVAVELEFEKMDNKFNQLSSEQHRTSEISQLMQDEGFRKCIYSDSLGKATIGFGHLMLPTDNFKCITYKKAIELLKRDYDYATNSVDTLYPWAHGEVRLVLINMTFQMGQTGVSKFVKTLDYLIDEEYENAAIELLESRWASQTERRALRLAGRILAISVHHGDSNG